MTDGLLEKHQFLGFGLVDEARLFGVVMRRWRHLLRGQDDLPMRILCEHRLLEVIWNLCWAHRPQPLQLLIQWRDLQLVAQLDLVGRAVGVPDDVSGRDRFRIAGDGRLRCHALYGFQFWLFQLLSQ